MGLVAVGVGMGITAWRSMRWTLTGRNELGIAVVSIGAVVCFPVALLLTRSPDGFAVPAAAALIGFALAFRSGGGGGDDADDEPPWWPSFERGLRDYERDRTLTPRRG